MENKEDFYPEDITKDDKKFEKDHVEACQALKKDMESDIRDEKRNELILHATDQNVASEDQLRADRKVIIEQYSKDKKEKFVKLFQARTILASIGNMDERRIAKRSLRAMRKKGLKSV